MASCEINIFFLTPAGFDGHLKLSPGEGEKSLPLIKQYEKHLLEMGCKPKPVPFRGGGGGGGGNWQDKKAAEPVAGKACPKCKGPVTLKEGKSANGNSYAGYACMKQREVCDGWLNISPSPR